MLSDLIICYGIYKYTYTLLWDSRLTEFLAYVFINNVLDTKWYLMKYTNIYQIKF